ncbi:MAG: PIN domain-containing protein [Planctomycetes bacterium]|nr:PIN domain-containing protein [Planctomycetota bacterium]
MTELFLESSVLVRYLIGEPEPLPEMATARAPVASALVEVEVGRALRRAHHERRIDAQDLELALDGARELLQRVRRVAITQAVRRRAAGPFPPLPGGGLVRSLDAIHIATALIWQEANPDRELVVATHDGRVAQAALAHGLQVVGWPERSGASTGGRKGAGKRASRSLGPLASRRTLSGGIPGGRSASGKVSARRGGGHGRSGKISDARSGGPDSSGKRPSPGRPHPALPGARPGTAGGPPTPPGSIPGGSRPPRSSFGKSSRAFFGSAATARDPRTPFSSPGACSSRRAARPPFSPAHRGR